MRRNFFTSVFSLTALFGSFAISLAGPADAASTGGVESALLERYQLSRMEMGSPATEGLLLERGSMLVLQANAVPVKALRFTQANTKSPRFHVWGYAHVSVGQDGILTASQGDLMLSRGTRVGVLDLKVDRDRVRVFTQTLEPVRLADGKTAYGCTEFAFPLDPPRVAAAMWRP